MKLTKLIHSTLLFEYKNTRILFDPGEYLIEEAINNLKNIELILITHNHPDHIEVAILKQILAQNKNAKIITNTEVSKLLSDEQIESETCDGGNETEFNDIKIKSFEFSHIEIWKDITLPQNTAYLLDSVLYNPGDSFGVIENEAKICTFMITGPGTPIKSAMEFAIEQKMKLGVGIHDGMLNRKTGSHVVPENFLSKYGKNYRNLNAGESITLK